MLYLLQINQNLHHFKFIVGDHGDTDRINAYNKPEKTMDVFS
jgi:hypothetical protein